MASYIIVLIRELWTRHPKRRSAPAQAGEVSGRRLGTDGSRDAEAVLRRVVTARAATTSPRFMAKSTWITEFIATHSTYECIASMTKLVAMPATYSLSNLGTDLRSTEIALTIAHVRRVMKENSPSQPISAV